MFNIEQKDSHRLKITFDNGDQAKAWIDILAQFGEVRTNFPSRVVWLYVYGQYTLDFVQSKLESI